MHDNYLKAYQKQLKLAPDGVLGQLTAKAMMEDLGITNKLLFAHMMGQMWHESGGFTAGRENLNYSAEGLLKIFKKYYSPMLAKAHARQPEKIANTVYANRMGNGDYASGDGWKYRGIFGLQLTGKDNITDFMKSIGISTLTDPDELLKDPRNYFLSGLFWFKDNGVDKLCINTSEACITAISKRVNGGTHGLEDRITKTRAVFKALCL